MIHIRKIIALRIYPAYKSVKQLSNRLTGATVRKLGFQQNGERGCNIGYGVRQHGTAVPDTLSKKQNRYMGIIRIRRPVSSSG